MTDFLHIDFETRSEVDLKTAGAHVYADHESTRVLCMAWKLGEQPTQLWRGGVLEPQADPFPTEVLDYIRSGKRVFAHNAAFEHAIWNGPLRRRFPHLPHISYPQWYCTMAAALAAGLPGGLDQLGEALELDLRKDRAGSAAMHRLCKPKGRDEATGAAVWDTRESLRDTLYAYCRRDVDVECLAAKLIPYLPRSEQEIWVLDQTINARGVAADLDFCRSAIEMMTVAKKRADKEMARITGHAVTATSQTAKLADWIRSRGVECTTVAKGAVEDLQVEASLLGAQAVVDALTLRSDANKASTAKYAAFIKGASTDGRVRGLLQYHGAATGRWSGRRVQPHNFVRIDFDEEAELLADTFEAAKSLHLDPLKRLIYLECLTGKSGFVALSRALRPTFRAGPGKTMVGGDWSNIEGRLNAWLAGEAWKLRAFEAFDRGEGPDLYKVTASSLLNKNPAEITKKERQNYGKVPDLAGGYQGGVGAMTTWCDLYGIDMTDVEKKTIIDMWRERHPAIKNNWYAVQDAAISAVQNPGYVAECCGGRVKYALKGKNWLVCVLPSGRMLHYRKPHIVEKETPWGEMRPALMAWSVNSYTKKWEPYGLYGGLLVENLCQAISACLLRHTMRACEARGWPVVMTVHDELVLEVDPGAVTPDDLRAVMVDRPDWAAGLPVAADCWTGEQYGH